MFYKDPILKCRDPITESEHLQLVQGLVHSNLQYPARTVQIPNEGVWYDLVLVLGAVGRAISVVSVHSKILFANNFIPDSVIDFFFFLLLTKS